MLLELESNFGVTNRIMGLIMYGNVTCDEDFHLKQYRKWSKVPPTTVPANQLEHYQRIFIPPLISLAEQRNPSLASAGPHFSIHTQCKHKIYSRQSATDARQCLMSDGQLGVSGTAD